MSFEGISFEDFLEMHAARKEAFIRREISETEYRKWLATRGFNATDIDVEIMSAINQAADEWYSKNGKYLAKDKKG
jgi:hypothetical protein